MSVTLWTVIAPTPKNKTLGAFTTRHRERMLLQSADDWALRLHSCRALSSTIATRSYNKSFHNEITVDKPHTRNLWINLICVNAVEVFHSRFVLMVFNR